MSFNKIHIHIPVPKDIFALLANRSLLRLGFGLTGVFVPIFLYELLGGSLYLLLAIYILFYLTLGILVPAGSKLLNTFGIKKILLMSIPFAVAALVSLRYGQVYTYWAIGGYFVFALLHRLSYWVPYQVDLSFFLGHKHIGSYMAFYQNALQIINALTPVAGGIIIAYFGFGSLSFFAALALISAFIPSLFIKDVNVKYEWSFTETFRKLFARKQRTLLYAYMADGAQTVISSVVWPIFIFELLDNKYTAVGLVTSLTIIAIIFLNTAVGKFIDHVGEKKALIYSSIFSSTGWILKMFVESAFQVFVSDTYHRLGRAANRTSFDTLTSEKAADNGHYIDEFTTLKEMAINLGRVLMLCIVCVLLFVFGNVRIIFIIAAFATLFMIALNKQVNIR